MIREMIRVVFGVVCCVVCVLLCVVCLIFLCVCHSCVFEWWVSQVILVLIVVVSGVVCFVLRDD